MIALAGLSVGLFWICFILACFSVNVYAMFGWLSAIVWAFIYLIKGEKWQYLSILQ